MPVKGHGTLLKLYDSGIYTTVGKRTKLSGPNPTVPDIDMTDLDSLAREFEAGLPDAGELKLTINYDPANVMHQKLSALVNSRALAQWKIVLANTAATEIPFSGYIKSWPLEGMETDQKVTIEVTIKISGPITWPTT